MLVPLLSNKHARHYELRSKAMMITLHQSFLHEISNLFKRSKAIQNQMAGGSGYRSLSGSPLLSLLEARTSSAAITVIIIMETVSTWPVEQ